MRKKIIDLIFLAGLKFSFGTLTPYLKILAAYFRYYITVLFKKPEKKEIIFIAGLPKSGTTWLESMLQDLNGYNSVMPVDPIIFESNYGESHNFVPSRDFFKKLSDNKWVIKLHSKFSESLNNLFKKHNIKPIIIYRQLDKVFESHFNYVRITKFHPDYSLLKSLNKKQAIDLIKNKYENEFNDWIHGWKNSGYLCINYEDLVDNTFSVLKKIFTYLGFQVDDQKINYIIENNSIEKLRSRSIQKEFYRGSYLKEIKNKR